MTLRVHNTLTRELETFTPIEPGHVRMYVCGITIYDLCHVGHARFLIAFDVVYRWLRTLGYRVTYVRNITDIDDKIIKRALERDIPIKQLTSEMTAGRPSAGRPYPPGPAFAAVIVYAAVVPGETAAGPTLSTVTCGGLTVTGDPTDTP